MSGMAQARQRREPAAYAFFDLDGTLISETSLLGFYRFYLETEWPGQGTQLHHDFTQRLAELQHRHIDRAEINAWFYRSCFAGISVERVRELSQRWLVSRLKDPHFLKQKVLDRMRWHRAAGAGCVLVTGSFREVAAPLARHFGMDDWLCAPLEQIDAIYTGALTAHPMIGAGKSRAIQQFLAERRIEPEACFGYGDDHSDIPFLQCVGHPHALSSGSAELLDHARTAGWSVLADQ